MNQQERAFGPLVLRLREKGLRPAWVRSMRPNSLHEPLLNFFSRIKIYKFKKRDEVMYNVFIICPSLARYEEVCILRDTDFTRIRLDFKFDKTGCLIIVPSDGKQILALDRYLDQKGYKNEYYIKMSS